MHSYDDTSFDATELISNGDRVRRATPEYLNQRIDRQTERNVRHYAQSDHHTILRRLQELDEEWDVERVLEVNASTLALSGLALAMTVDRRFLVLPAVVMGFLLQHGLQGWCPPLPLLRRLGVRTQSEIDREKVELQERLAMPGTAPVDYVNRNMPQ